jgi:hypothetical protein
MLRRRLAICCAVMLTTFVAPNYARAGLADIIWEMSGPQLVGVVLRCRVPVDGGKKSCDVRLARNFLYEKKNPEKVWFAIEGGAYVSTGHNSGGIDYKFGRIGMFAFEPMMEFRYGGDIRNAYDKTLVPRVGAIYGGIGPMINSFIVRGSTPAFAKYGVKLRPLAITYSDWTLEYNVRLYPDGFTPDEFGFGPRLDINRPFEAVQSISVSIPWLTWRLSN